MHRHVFILAWAVVLTVVLCGGCAGRRGNVTPALDVPAGTAPVTGVDIPLPSPADVRAAGLPARAVSAAELLHTGREFMPGLNQLVAARQNNALFTPSWAGEGATFTDVSYAIYRFDVQGFTDHTELGQLRLRLTWDRPPVNRADCWLALCDWDSARWQLYAVPADDVLKPQSGFGPYLIPSTSELYVAVILSGTATAELFTLSFSESQQSDWWMSGANAQHTGRSRYVGPQDGKMEWAFKSFGQGGSFSNPFIGPDGTVYVGCQDYPIFTALNPDGTQRWEQPWSNVYRETVYAAQDIYYVGSGGFLQAFSADGTLIWSASVGPGLTRAAVAQAGTIYVGSADMNLYALNPDSTLLWTFPTGGIVGGSPVIAEDGTIYIGCGIDKKSGGYEHKLYAVNPDGSKKWEYETDADIHSGVFTDPALAEDGTIYFGDKNHIFYALNPDGSLKWSYTTGGSIKSSPAVAGDGTVYFGSEDGYVYALNPDGSLKWNYHTQGPVTGAVTLDSNGLIYVGSTDGNLYALQPDGHGKWFFHTAAVVTTKPAVAADGTVYLGGGDQRLYAIDAEGQQKWTYSFGGGIYSNPAFAADGTIYANCQDGNVYAVNPDGSLKWFRTLGESDQSFPAIPPNGMHYVSGPAVASDGTIYVGSASEDLLYALTPNGGIKWAFAADSPIYASPAIDKDGTVYIGSGDGMFYAVLPDGELKWEYQYANTLGTPLSDPAIGPDGTLYLGAEDRLYAVSSEGKFKWRFVAHGFVTGAPAIGPDGTIYAGSTGFMIYAITPGGKELWRCPTMDRIVRSPVLGTDGTVYACAVWYNQYGAITDSSLYAFKSNGKSLWTYDPSWVADSNIALSADGTLYVGTKGTFDLHALNPDGTEKSAIPAPEILGSDAAGSNFAIGPDGRIYAGVGRYMVCYGDDSQ